MKKRVIDEATVRLTAGMLELIQVLTIVLETQGMLNRAAFTYAVEKRLEQHTDNEIDAAPLAMMLNFLRPESPPHPALRLIQGGKA